RCRKTSEHSSRRNVVGSYCVPSPCLIIAVFAFSVRRPPASSRFPYTTLFRSGFFEGTGMPDPGWWEALWPDPTKVLRDVGVTPGMRVGARFYSSDVKSSHVAKIARSDIAIDIDAALLEAAKMRMSERGGAPNC